MKIAIPAFHSKVSPRFDTAQELVLMEIAEGHIIARARQPMASRSVSEKIRTLLDQEVDTLICGGIDRLSRQQLGLNRIEVYAWVTGEIEDAVSCFLGNDLNSGTILGRNGRKEGRWRFRQRRFLYDVLQKSTAQTDREVNTMQAENQSRKGRGQRSGGRGRGKGRGRRGAGCQGNGTGRRQGNTPSGAGAGGRRTSRRDAGRNANESSKNQ